MAQADISASDEFSVRLSLALQACNLSRSQLASILGVNKSLVSRWLSGEMNPSSYNLARISAEFAKLRPGFNMTMWSAPRADFEAVLGLVARALPPVTQQLQEFETDTATARPWQFSWIYAVIGSAVCLALGFSVLWAWHKTPFSSQQAERPPINQIDSAVSVAVMPFVNMSGDPTKEYLGDGISEEILNDLSNTPNLRVAARTSSFSFKRKNAGVEEIAHKLNVRNVLEGSIRLEGNRIRVVAQLIEAKEGFHLWSASYDRDVSDILNVQDEIARAIVLALTQKLVPQRPHRTIDPKAYQDYLQAQYFLNQRTPAGQSRAESLVRDALAHQPDFAAAYALRGHALLLLSDQNQQFLSESRHMTAEALKLDPDNEEAVDTDLQRALRMWDWAAVYKDGSQLRARRKPDAVTYNGLFFLYSFMGFPREAAEAARLAVELDPLHFSYRYNFSIALWQVGRADEAIAAAEAALALQPGHPNALDELCIFNAGIGRVDRARIYARQIAAQASMASAWAVENCKIEIALQSETPQQVRARLAHIDRKAFPSAILGVLYARAGDNTGAANMFEHGPDQWQFGLTTIPYNPKTPKALLNDPRWLALWHRPVLRNWQHFHDRIAADLAAKHG